MFGDIYQWTQNYRAYVQMGIVRSTKFTILFVLCCRPRLFRLSGTRDSDPSWALERLHFSRTLRSIHSVVTCNDSQLSSLTWHGPHQTLLVSRFLHGIASSLTHFISSLTSPIGSTLAASTFSSGNPLDGFVASGCAWPTKGSILAAWMFSSRPTAP